jgi:glutathione synthase/RimK-type ligase-like ATP-grasp enzyme
MKPVYLITDYQNRFGTKYTAVPYRSGMDKNVLTSEFQKYGIEPHFINASGLLEEKISVKDTLIIYTSSEDTGHHYKSFLEDLILSLESMGAIIIPSYKYLRAHNNKVLMEMLRKEWGAAIGDTLASRSYGSLEELEADSESIEYPAVIKRPEGFKSRGVFLAHNRNELIRIAGKISRSFHLKNAVKDLLRKLKHPGFTPESQNRRKFIVQKFVPELKNDWKVLVFGRKYYFLHRETRKNDFRASGSGLLSFPGSLPDGLADFTKRAFEYFDVPFISLDITFDGKSFNIVEAQFVYFGTYTIEHSEFWFEEKASGFELINGRSVIESVYAESVAEYLRHHKLLQ